jgi:hypothetical protein
MRSLNGENARVETTQDGQRDLDYISIASPHLRTTSAACRSAIGDAVETLSAHAPGFVQVSNMQSRTVGVAAPMLSKGVDCHVPRFILGEWLMMRA